MNTENNPPVPPTSAWSKWNQMARGVLKRPKFLLAIIVAASFATNLYLVNKVWNGEKPVMHSPVSEDVIVMTTSGGLLEVSTINASEQFDASHDHKVLGVSIANTATQIRVPVVYRYHIELAPTWRVVLREGTFIVVAPSVKPSLPVAIDTSRLEKKSFGAWSFFTEKVQLEQLQRSISQALAKKADSQIYVQLQREVARKTTAEFVAKWLISQPRWKSVSAYPIRVVFADEPIQVLGNLSVPFVGNPSSSSPQRP